LCPMYESELDVQITRPFFVVEREPDVNWSLERSITGIPYQPAKKGEIPCILAYVKNGSAYYTFNNDKRQIVTRGNVIFLRKGDLYSALSSPDDPWSFYSCCFGLMPEDDASLEILNKLPHIFRCSDSTYMRDSFSQLYRTWTAKETGYLLKCRCLLLDILFFLLWDEKRRSLHSVHYKTIDSIIELMRVNYSHSYSLAELSELSGLSASYFRMLFKQMTGCTTVEFQNRLKIEKAKNLLISRTCNVTEAAVYVGFNDVFYFSRIFKKLTGKNPSEYLK